MTWNKDDKGGHARRKRERGSHRQTDRSADKAAAGDGSAWDASKEKADKRRKRSRVGRVVIAIAALLLIAVALLPTIASWIAPGIIASQASNAIAGRVEVSSVSLGWFGSQKVTGVRVFTDTGEQRAEIDAAADKGLLSLALAGGDYGTVRIAGSADLSPDEQGRGFLEHTIGIEPAPPEPAKADRPKREPKEDTPDRPRESRPAAQPAPQAEPITLPPNLKASLVLDNLSITYTDPAAGSNGNGGLDALRVDNLAGTVNLNTAGETNAKIRATIGARRAGETIYADSGSFELTARVTGLTDAAGVVQTDTASIEADAALTDLSTALLDTMPEYAGLGEQALGRTANATLSARGTGADLAVTLDANAESLDAHAPLRVSLTDSRITAPEPITARLDLDRLAGLAGSAVDDLRAPDADLYVHAFPEINLTITGLNAPIPQSESLDLRGAGAVVTLDIGELPATMTEPTTGQRRDVTLIPGTITLDAADLAEPVRLTADVRTSVDGADAGTLTADLTASNLLDSEGAPATTPSLRGEINARSLSVAAVQPIAAAAGVDLIALLGDTADLAIVASPLESAQAGDDPLATAVTIEGTAPRASVTGRVTLANSVVNAKSIVAKLDRLDPVLAGMLAPAGIELIEASGAELSIRDLTANLEQIGEGDYSAAAATVTAKLTSFAATMTETGETVATTVLNARAVAAPLGEGVSMTSNVNLRMNDAPAGVLSADLTAAGLLDSNGAPRQGLPSRIAGTITAEKVRTAALQPFLGTDALSLPKDIGPAIDLTLTASSSPSADDPAGAIPPTDLTLDIASDKLNGRGAFRLEADRVSTTGEGLTLTLAQVGSVLERTGALGETVRLNKPGWLRLTLAGLDLPLDPEGTPVPEKATGNAELRIAGVVVAANNEAASFDNLVAALALTPDAAPVLTLDGATTSGEKKGTIKGRVELRNAFAATAADGTLLARPVGKVELRRIPTSIAGLAGVTLPVDGGGTVALADLAAAATGPDIDLTLELGSPDADKISATTELRSARTMLTGNASLRPGPAGEIELLDINAEGEIRLTQYLARTMARAFAPSQYHAVSIPEPGQIAITTKTNAKGVVSTEIALDRTTLANLPAPDGAGGFQTLDPIALVGALTAQAPLAVLKADPGTHAVNMKASLEGYSSDAPDTRALTLRANAATTLVEMKPSGETTADVRIATQRTEWLDALAGLDGLLTEAVGKNLRLDAALNAEAAKDGSMGDGTASIEITSPNLKTASPITLALSSEKLELTEPAEINWTLSKKLMDILAPVKEDATGQLTIARSIPVTLRAEELRLPLGGAPTQTRAKATLSAPALPLRFPDGSEHEYRGLTATLTTKPNSNAATLVASATDPSAPKVKALGIDAVVVGLPDGTEEWTPDGLALTGKAQLRAFPVRLLDAMAAGDGTLVEMLGQSLRLDADIERFPRRGGTFVFDARTEQARTGINATVRLHPADRDRLAAILDEPMRTVLTHFAYEISNKSVPLLPMFARVEKIEGEHQPATVTINRLVAPTDGDVALIIMQGTVDPGVVDFDLDQGLETILKAAGQRDAGVAGDRLEPFTIAMNKGVASFSDLAVPFGEFVFTGEGKIDLVRETEDIVLHIPAGALAAEALGSAGGLLESVTIPVRRKGPLGQKNQWTPDLSEAFKPENIIKEGIDKGLKDLIPGGLKDVLPGGGGG